MKILNLFKFLVLICVMLGFWFLYSKINYFKEPINSSRLESQRPNAFFLELDESILEEIKVKNEYAQLSDVELQNVWKTQLFESPEKINYNF